MVAIWWQPELASHYDTSELVFSIYEHTRDSVTILTTHVASTCTCCDYDRQIITGLSTFSIMQILTKTKLPSVDKQWAELICDYFSILKCTNIYTINVHQAGSNTKIKRKQRYKSSCPKGAI